MNTVAGAFIVVGLAVLIWRAVEAVLESCENIREDKAAYDSERQSSSPRFQRR